MALDWHSEVRMTKQERIEWVKKYCKEELERGEPMEKLLREKAPAWKKPCSVVGAPKMKDRPTFEADIREYVEKRKADAEEEAKNKHPNRGYIDYWRSRTVEAEMEDAADKWDCENCPLLKELQGADSTGSFFLGVTVSSCDFRGKVIGQDDVIAIDLQEEAYNEMEPNEMLDYADRLEEEIDRLREEGHLTKVPYDEYSREYDADDFPLKDPKMSEEEYEKSLHWREENIRRAIHWLRTCAKYGIRMGTSY